MTMRKLERPQRSVEEVFVRCAKSFRNPLQTKLLGVTADIVASAADFDVAAAASRLDLFPRNPQVGAHVSKQEMVDVYEKKFARKGSVGRSVYEALLAAPPHGICPLCGQRIASTLDHHLPKGEYPALAVTPCNLVPACSDCNFAKLEQYPTSEEEQTIHPYFDDFDGEVWVVAEVLELNPPALLFAARPPVHWTPVKAERAKRHFTVFGLAKLYGAHAVEELRSIEHYVVGLLKRGGPAELRSFLEEQAASRGSAHRNSWQAATYRALAASTWYCTGTWAL